MGRCASFVIIVIPNPSPLIFRTLEIRALANQSTEVKHVESYRGKLRVGLEELLLLTLLRSLLVSRPPLELGSILRTPDFGVPPSTNPSIGVVIHVTVG